MAASSSKAKARAKRGAEQLTKGFRGAFGFLFCLSGIINVLALTSAFYMLQIYDRALTSGSIPTLLALSVLAIGLYLFQGMFDVIRSQVLVRIGARLDRRIAPLAHQVAIDMPRFGFSTAEALERGRDVDTVRGFLGSQGPIALFDLPWMPLYLVFVYMLHPWLGGLTLAGAFVLTVLTIATELMTRRLSASTHKAVIAAQRDRRFQCPQRRGAEGDGLHRPRGAAVHQGQRRASGAADQDQRHQRHLRRLLAGAAHAAAVGAARARRLPDHHRRAVGGRHHRRSVASTRALAPVDLAIGNWKSVVAARSAWRRLKETVVALENAVRADGDARPGEFAQGREDHRRGARLRPRADLSDVEFELKAGQALGIIGPSGGGKTTLVRALTGIWPRCAARPARRRRARPMGRGRARQEPRLPAAGRGAPGRHDRGEHRPLRPRGRSARGRSRRPRRPASTR